ncbi:MAG: aspartyl protease family protein [Fimbriimonadales bacterium]|nr:aspartyl protease family protein [Fimbriimonadales bacterium]MDW8051489.1 aspartyl protease family protein [Armatimonadota bacterium]
MMRGYGVLCALALIQGLLANDAATRFQQAIEKHGGSAYRALAERGVKLSYDITSEYGGKSNVKRVVWLRGTKRVIETRYGDDEAVVGFDGTRGWRKNEYLSSSIAQEEEWSLRDETYTNFVQIPHWLSVGTLVGGEESRLPDGRPAYRITVQLPEPEYQKSLPQKPDNKLHCYLDNENRIVGIEYQRVNYETDKLSKVQVVYHGFRAMRTPLGEVVMPIETRIFMDGAHVATYFMTAMDAETPIDDSRFQRPPHGTSPAVRDNLPVKVPFRLSTNSLYVQVYLNGKGPYWIIYDTGASSTWIDDAIVKEAGLEKIPNSDYWATLVYGSFPSYRVRVKSLKIGEAEVRDIVIGAGAVWQTPLGNDSIDGKRVIGLLGRETIAAFQTTVDFAERTITFEAPDAPMPEGVVIPFEMAGDHILVTMTVGQKNQPIRMIVDTGAAMNLLPPSYKHDKNDGPSMTVEKWFKRLGEFFEGDEYNFFTGDLLVYRINRMQLGPLVFSSVYAYQKLSENARSDTVTALQTRYGLLGVPIMRHYKVTYNYFREQMVWRPNTAAERAADNAGYGIWWRRQGKDIVVRWVMPMSDADLAGVKAGDKIVLIDGQSPANWSEKQLVERLSYVRAGRPLKLTVERAGKRLEFNLIASNYEL